MTKKVSDLSVALSKIHKQIKTDISNYNEDQKIAKELERYFNYLNKENSSENTLGEILKQTLTVDAIQEIQNKYLIQKTKIDKRKRTKDWRKFELKISAMITDLVNQISNSKQSYIKNASGTSTSYVDLSSIPEDLLEDFKNYLQVYQEDEYFRTYKKQQKNDVTITASLDFPLGENLTFSIKNYSGKVKLEKVNVLKAYIAAINHCENLVKSNEKIYKDFDNYYIKKSIPDDPKITAHLNHIIYIYGLTGLGTQLDVDSFVQSTRFLVENTGTYIKVYSTKEIIYDMISRRNKKYDFFFEEPLEGQGGSYALFQAKKNLTK